MINIKDIAPGIVIDMRYASTENFTGQKLYAVGECLLCKPAALRLARVQANLEKKGLGLKVWDCYRPLSVQKKLWNVVPDPRYVADPKSGSRHNRGASVDLTLVNARGEELRMPTLFDDFSERAHRDCKNLPAEVKKNREVLQSAMEAEGFIGLPTEWWHFDDPEWTRYALRDEPLGSTSLKKDVRSTTTTLIPPEASQMILVVSSSWSSTEGTLQLYERLNKKWAKAGNSWIVNLGFGGMAWSRGIPLALGPGPQKKEGDHCTPAGVFDVGQAYGLANEPPPGTKWKYQTVYENWICVDDPKSKRYNEIFLSTDEDKKDWSHAEKMKRDDPLYTWVINIEQNPHNVKGCGSCLFFHVWRRPHSPTEGCTAMEESKIIHLMKWLDPAQNPVVAQFPAGVARRLRKEGLLP